jgi:hypothetical protein
MNRTKPLRVLFTLGALIALPLALAGCEHFSFLTAERSSSPPESGVEIIPRIQDRNAEIWRPGYWEPRGDSDFEWIPGEVIPRPSPTAVWKSATWVRHVYGWTYEEGHWE